MQSTARKVGELAKQIGVSVRTLHVPAGADAPQPDGNRAEDVRARLQWDDGVEEARERFYIIFIY